MTSNAASAPPVTTAAVPSPREAVPTTAVDAVDAVDHEAGHAEDHAVAEKAGSDGSDGSVGVVGTDHDEAAEVEGTEVEAAEVETADAEAADAEAAEAEAAEVEGADVEGGADAELGPDPAGLHGRLVEAREQLVQPEGPRIPEPRSPQGVMVPPTFGGAEKSHADIATTIEAVVADLAAIRANPDEPVHHALVRLGELSYGAIPDAGWSLDESLDPDVVAAAAALATELHTATAALLERLDAENLASSAVVVESAVTSLQVMRMVADLEVFARSRG